MRRLSRLFGEQSANEEGGGDTASGSAEAQDPDLAPPVDPRPKRRSPRKESDRPAAGSDTQDPDEREDEGTAERSESSKKERETGYLGMGQYARGDGVVERITPYVRPDQAEALRVAVARKRDPRGRDVSQIIQSLLDEAGYKGPVRVGKVTRGQLAAVARCFWDSRRMFTSTWYCVVNVGFPSAISAFSFSLSRSMALASSLF